MKRVLPYLLFFLCIGILLAYRLSSPVVMVLAVILPAAVCVLVTRRIIAALFPVMMLVGMSLTLAEDTDPLNDALLDNAAAARESVCAEGVIVSYYKNTDGYVYKINTDRLTTESGKEITSRYGIRLMTSSEFKVGDRVSIDARIYVHNGRFNPSDFDSRLYLKIRGYNYSFYCDDPEKSQIALLGSEHNLVYTLKNIMYAMRVNINNIYDKYFDETQAGILKSIITGDRSGLDTEAADSFRDAGIYHFLAISGLHLSVITACLLAVFGRIKRNFSYAVTAVFLVLYCIMVGSGVSVMRAVIMACVFMSCRMLGRSYDLINSASFAALVLLLVNPLLLYDTGFLYSFGAVYGIALMAAHVRELKKHRAVVSAAAVSFGASVFSRIITLFSFYKVNIFDIPINMVLALPLSAIVASSFAFGVAALILPDMRFFALPLKIGLNLLMKVSELLGGFSVVTVGHPSWSAGCLILVSALLFVLLALRPDKRRALVLLASVPLVCAVSAAARDRSVSLSFLYVGQGDSCVINNGGSAYIIDCGGNALSDIGADTGRYRIMPYLDYCGIKTVKGVFISHTDADHIKGLFDMLGKTKIERVYLSEFVDENEHYETLCRLAEANNVPIVRISAGDLVVDGELSFKCLFPYEYDDKDNNDNSMVLLFEHGENRVLFTGDINQKAERQLLGTDIEADILKAAHHGSKGSSGTEFLDAVNAEAAIASAGKGNRYGHPADETVKRLKESGAEVYITYDGMVRFESDGKRLVRCVRER